MDNATFTEAVRVDLAADIRRAKLEALIRQSYEQMPDRELREPVIRRGRSSDEVLDCRERARDMAGAK